MTTQEQVTEFLATLEAMSPELFAIVSSVRTLFWERCSRCTESVFAESIKYGGVLFWRDTDAIGGVFPYRHHVSVEFSHGADFDDPAGLLMGAGKYRRHLSFRQLAQIDRAVLTAFIDQAVVRGGK